MTTIEDLNKAKIELESVLASGRVPEVEQIDSYRLAVQALANALPVLVRRDCAATLRAACQSVSDQYRQSHHVVAVQEMRRENKKLI
jgi:hypothetical protein